MREAAARVGLAYTTFSRLNGAGLGPVPAQTIGLNKMYRPEDIDAWDAARKRPAA